jgi:hypothetical protein
MGPAGADKLNPMKFLKKIIREITFFVRRTWFLIALLGVAFLVYMLDGHQSEVILWITLSYISSFVFYTLTIYLPERVSSKNIHRVVVPYLQSVISDTKNIFYGFLAASKKYCDIENLKEEDFLEVFKNVNPTDRSTRLDYLGFGNWFEYLEHQKKRIRRTMDKILTYERYLDSDFILLLEKNNNSTFFEILDFIEHKPMPYKDFAFLADSYRHCYERASQLEAYLRKYSGDV